MRRPITDKDTTSDIVRKIAQLEVEAIENPFSAVQVPWTTPPIIAGLLLNGWQGAVVQIIIIAMSTAVYFPFVRAQDKAMLAEEAGEGSDGEPHDGNEEAGEPALHH